MRTFLLALVVLVAIMTLSILAGAGNLGWQRVLGEIGAQLTGGRSPLSQREAAIVWQLRAPRVLLAGLVSAALAGSGAAFQGVFRNPLADPYLLGAAAGAGMAATTVMVLLPATNGWVIGPLPLAAFAEPSTTSRELHCPARFHSASSRRSPGHRSSCSCCARPRGVGVHGTPAPRCARRLHRRPGGARRFGRRSGGRLDARDRLVTLPLIWSSLLVGAIPRMGKTFAARLIAAAAALDPFVRMYVFNGKGDRSWLPFEEVAHVYGSGIRDEVVELLVQSLRELQADMNGRNERMSKLPADVCPEDKLTPAMSRNRRLNMPLTVVAIDEVQRYLEHPTHGEEILALLTDLAKVAPSAGIMLVLATQKPDSKIIPDSLRGQLSTRFAMKVMTYQASDTILGAGSYSAAMDASTLLRSHKGVGILLGADDGELAERGGQIVRTHLLGGPGVEQICARGRALREENDTLTGMAAGEMPVEARPASVLYDLARVFEPGEDKAWSEVLVERLAERNSSAYDGWSVNQLATALKPYGVTPTQVWSTDDDGRSTNKRGYVRDAVTEALAARIDKGR